MSEIINKNNVTLDQAIDSKSLKKKSDEELERMLQTLLTTDHDNDSTVNIIIAELMKRGVSKEEVIDKDKVEKSFDILHLNDFIEKSKGPWKKGKQHINTNFKLISTNPNKVFGIRKAIYKDAKGNIITVVHHDYSQTMRKGNTLDGYSVVYENNSLEGKEFKGENNINKITKYIKEKYNINHDVSKLKKYNG